MLGVNTVDLLVLALLAYKKTLRSFYGSWNSKTFFFNSRKKMAHGFDDFAGVSNLSWSELCRIGCCRHWFWKRESLSRGGICFEEFISIHSRYIQCAITPVRHIFISYVYTQQRWVSRIGLWLHLYSANFFAENFTPWENACVGMRLTPGIRVCFFAICTHVDFSAKGKKYRSTHCGLCTHPLERKTHSQCNNINAFWNEGWVQLSRLRHANMVIPVCTHVELWMQQFKMGKFF